MWTARRARRWRACAAAGRSRTSPRRSRCGTLTCRSRSTSAPAGPRCRTPRTTTTRSRRSGRCSSAFRTHLCKLGLGVAESMDTAQRGMGLDWAASLELIRRSLEAAKATPGAKIACGAGTDHLTPGPDVTLDRIIGAYEEQIEAIE